METALVGIFFAAGVALGAAVVAAFAVPALREARRTLEIMGARNRELQERSVRNIINTNEDN